MLSEATMQLDTDMNTAWPQLATSTRASSLPRGAVNRIQPVRADMALKTRSARHFHDEGHRFRVDVQLDETRTEDIREYREPRSRVVRSEKSAIGFVLRVGRVESGRVYRERAGYFWCD